MAAATPRPPRPRRPRAAAPRRPRDRAAPTAAAAPRRRARAAGGRAEAAEATREAILDAAEQLLRRGGTEAVRLQEIATRVGVTHPALLYHFKSRDGLLAALFQRASRRMREGLLDELVAAPAPTTPAATAALFARVHDRVADPRRAPLLAWLLACGEEPFPADEAVGLAEIAAHLHALRSAADPAAADDVEGTRFGVMAMTLMMFGDLLLGGATRRRLGLADDAATRARFRTWLAARLAEVVAAARPTPTPV